MAETFNPIQEFPDAGWGLRIKSKFQKPTVNVSEAERGQAKKVNGYFSPEMANAEEPMFDICDRFAGGFKVGRFGLIIADDTSGRLPGLVLREVAGEISRREDRDTVPLYFIDAGLNATQDTVGAQVSKLAEKIAGIETRRALAVSEFLHTGTSMAMLNGALAVRGIALDIAVLEAKDFRYRNIRLGPDSTLFISKLADGGGYLHNKSHLTGLTRDRDTKKIIQIKSDDTKQHAAIREMLARAREDVHLMAQRAIQRIYPEPQADIISQ